MQVHHSLDLLPPIPSPVVTIGSFDGVHAGHRVIIQRLNALAKRVAGTSVLITFWPHPRLVLYPDTAGKDLKMINSFSEKCLLLEEAGLDHLVLMEFTGDFSRTTSDEFVKHYLVEKLHAHTIVVGFNHFFGHNKEGSYASLYRDRERYGYRVEEIPEQEIQNETVSSTKIRRALGEGNIQRANACLEHFYIVQAQLETHAEALEEVGHSPFVFSPDDPYKLLPPRGAYAVSFQQRNRQIKGVVLINSSGNSLFPLEQPSPPDGEIVGIHFHKQIEAGQSASPEDLMEAVRELIY
ncbi:MAG: FAD synthetase family protein [Bacteroidota bacterium]